MDPGTLDLLGGLAGAVLAPLGFVAWWCFVCFILGLVSGWHGLADRYRTHEPAPRNQRSLQGGMVGWVSHQGTLSLGAAEDGLDLRVLVLFRPGHPPLRIPWDDIVDEGDAFSIFVKMAKLRLGPHGPTLRIRRDTWESLRPGDAAQNR
jgi:hypothetical protein